MTDFSSGNWRLRPDLEFYEVGGYAEQTWVLRDPLTLECFHLGAAEYFLVTQLKNGIRLKELRTRFEQYFSPRQMSRQELQQLLMDWWRKGFLQGGVPAGSMERLQKPQTGQSVAGQLLRHPLVIRLRGWDPQFFFAQLIPFVRWIFHPFCLLLGFIVLVTSATVAISEWGSIWQELETLPLLLNGEILSGFLVAIGISKILHEWGHALACHYYGGRCHEMGILFLAMIPCLYCNVTDTWTFQRRRERILVSAAGILADLFFASLAILVWWQTHPGNLHTVALAVAVICSFNSLLWNGNPLMRYDGYYILSDLVGVPNLRSQSLRQARLGFWRVVYGPRLPHYREKSSPWLAIYGWCAGLYLWLVMGLIVYGLYQFLKPWNLEAIAILIGLVSFAGSLMHTARQLRKESAQEYSLRNSPTTRAVWGTFGLLALILLVLFYPFPRRIPAVGILQPADSIPIVAADDGVIVSLASHNQTCHAGDSLLVLKDSSTVAEIQALKTELARWQAYREALAKKRIEFRNSSTFLLLAEERLAEIQDRMERLITQAENLTFNAPHSGLLMVQQPEARETQGGFDERTFSSRIPVRNRLGEGVTRGQYLGELVQPGQYEVLLLIEQHWIEQLQPGADAIAFLPENHGSATVGTFQEVSRRPLEADLNEEVSYAQQELIRLQQRLQPVTTTTCYAGRVRLQTDTKNFSFYQQCRVRIAVRPASLWQRFVEFWLRTWKT